jgi:hypothetical protein
VFIVPSSNLFPKSLTNEFRHAVASTPPNTARCSAPFPLRRSVLASLPRILFCFGAISFLNFRYGGGGRGRVSPKGETDGIQMRTRFCQIQIPRK